MYSNDSGGIVAGKSDDAAEPSLSLSHVYGSHFSLPFKKHSSMKNILFYTLRSFQSRLRADHGCVTLCRGSLDKHRHAGFWSWIPQRTELQTGEKPRLGQPECPPKSAPPQTGSWVFHSRSTRTSKVRQRIINLKN